MEPDTFTWLTSPEARAIIASIDPTLDPLTLNSSVRKAHPELATDFISAALTQSQLRHKAAQRWNRPVHHLLFTTDGLSQASRPEASAVRIALLKEHFSNVKTIADLTCGLGFDTQAFYEAGYSVTGVELSPDTAHFARFNTDAEVNIVIGDATSGVRPEADLYFIDPARRDPNGPRTVDGSAIRQFDPESWSPSWSFIEELAATHRVAVKAAPGMNVDALATWDVYWFSIDGQLVESFLMNQGTGRRIAALITTSANNYTVDFVESHTDITSGPLHSWLVVADPAIVRAGALDVVADHCAGVLVHPLISWMTCQNKPELPINWATTYEILESLKFDEKKVAQRISEIGAAYVTITTRGIELDIEKVRKQILKKPVKGAGELVVAVFRSDDGPIALLCRRLTKRS